MRRFRLIAEYDGRRFCGWQFQPDARSVQGEIEAALRSVCGAEVRVVGAGRTDAGVHATGQSAHFDLDTRLGPLELRQALNAVLPQDLALLDLRCAPSDFHARHDALGKEYVYRILNRPVASPERRRTTWHLRSRLDLDAMREASELLLGEHDFAAFRGAHGGAPPDEITRRSLDRFEWTREADEVQLLASGRSFLRYMVRNLVGTLVEVGLGRRPAADVKQVLESRDRSRGGATAPAQGLCLRRVLYAEESL